MTMNWQLSIFLNFEKGLYSYAEGTTWNNNAKKDNFQNFKHYTLTFGDVIGPKKSPKYHRYRSNNQKHVKN